MGQANAPIAFHKDADSPSGDGLRSIVSEPIENLSPDEFWALLCADLRERQGPAPEAAMREAPESEQPDETMLVEQSGRIYDWWLFHGRDEAKCYCYGADESLSTLESRGTLRVHRNPFRIEFWSLVYGKRESGDRLKSVMEKIIRTMRSRAGCAHDVDSPSGGGLKSVLSDPILDSILSPAMFWRQTKEFIKKRADKILPDGGIVQKSATGWEIFETPSSVTKHVFNDSTKEIVSYTYRDSELSEHNLDSVRHLRIHTKPYRLEMWMAPADKRLAGSVELQQLLSILGPVLSLAKTIQEYPNPVADATDISRLQAEVSALRKEVSDALETLHEGAGALESL